MRVTPGMLNGQIAGDLQAALAALARQQHRLSTGRRIEVPSDDPAGVAQALALRSRQAATEQFRKNVAEARARHLSADAALQSIAEVVTRAREAAVQGASDTSDALARRDLGSQVDQLLEELVTLANSRGQQGEYLFGGQESTVAPYVATRDAAGRITAVGVNPRGIDGVALAEVSEGVTVPTGVSGTAVVGQPGDPTYAFDVLIRLRDGLDSNDGAGVRARLDEVTAALDRVGTPVAVVGARLGWLASLDDRLGSESVDLAGTLSRVEDLDIPGAVQEFQQLEILYQAALVSSARLLQPSLLEFLK